MGFFGFQAIHTEFNFAKTRSVVRTQRKENHVPGHARRAIRGNQRQFAPGETHAASASIFSTLATENTLDRIRQGWHVLYNGLPHHIPFYSGIIVYQLVPHPSH